MTRSTPGAAKVNFAQDAVSAVNSKLKCLTIMTYFQLFIYKIALSSHFDLSCQAFLVITRK